MKLKQFWFVIPMVLMATFVYASSILSIPQGGTGLGTIGASSTVFTSNGTNGVWQTNAGTTYGATYPVTLTGSNFGLAFGTTTANTWSLLNSFSNATSTLFTSTTAWIGTLNLTNALTVANGGTGLSSIGASSTVLTSNGSSAVWETASGGGGSSASSTLLTDNNTFSGTNVFSNAASTFAGTWQGYNASTFNNKVSSTSLSVTTIGSSGAATYTPSTGVFNIPQYSGTTYTAFTPLAISAGNVLSIATSSASQSGFISASDYQLLHTATSTFTSPLSWSGATNAVTLSTAGTWSGNAATASALTPGATINGVTFTGASNIVVASTTLLANNNTFSGLDTFTNATSTLFTSTTAWIGTLNLTNPLSIANGGIGLSSIGANGTYLSSNGSVASWATPSFTAASSTLLIDNNTFSGSDVFSKPTDFQSGWLLYNGGTFAYASSTNLTTVFGIGAGGNSATTSNSSSLANTAIGYQALSADVYGSGTGGANVAVGVQALQSNTSGFNNVALGMEALQKVTTGTNETAVGAGALQNNTTSPFNTAVGGSALQYTTTGGSNTAIGWAALENNTTGSSSVAIGYAAGDSGHSVAYNNDTFVGYNTNENSNAAITDTTAFGYESAYNNTGWDSTFLGELAGQNVTSANNDILIGYNALAPSATAGNQLNLGNMIFGTGLAATSSSTTVIPTPTGNVGIGTTTPASTLTINGHIGTDGGAPALTSCGTSPSIVVGSTDTAGEVTEGSVSTGCTITFKTAYARAPFCTVSEQSGLAASYTISASAITLTNIGALSSTKIDYHCISNDE